MWPRELWIGRLGHEEVHGPEGKCEDTSHVRKFKPTRFRLKVYHEAVICICTLTLLNYGTWWNNNFIFFILLLIPVVYHLLFVVGLSIHVVPPPSISLEGRKMMKELTAVR